MIEELKKYIEDLFTEAPRTQSAYELKEELLANSTDRYYDLLKQGIPEKEAFDIVVGSIGDINQLLFGMNESVSQDGRDDATIKKIAIFRAIAIGMYIMGAAFIVVTDYVFNSDIGIVIFLVFAAVATGILVYINSAYPKYEKKNETIVEDFKEWNSGKKRSSAVKSSVNTIIWMMALMIYFIISFLTSAWYITWLIFLAAACVQAIVTLMFHLKDM